MPRKLRQITLDRFLCLTSESATPIVSTPQKISKRFVFFMFIDFTLIIFHFFFRRKYRSQNKELRKALEILVQENTLLRRSHLSDVSKPYNYILFDQIQQQPNQQQPIDYNTQQPIDQIQQQPNKQPNQQQPNDQILDHDEFIHFRPLDQTDDIIILKSTPVIAPTNTPTNLSTVGLFSDIEEFIEHFSHSLENFNL